MPLARATRPSADRDSPRDLIGAPSYDALAIAIERGAVLYADDLGLRRLALEGSEPAPSASTITIVDALCRRGAFGGERRDDLIRSLALRRYGYIVPTPELLVPPLLDGSLKDDQLDTLFELLTAGALSLTDAARVGAEIVGTVAAATIRTVTPESAARRALETLARRWAPSLRPRYSYGLCDHACGGARTTFAVWRTCAAS